MKNNKNQNIAAYYGDVKKVYLEFDKKVESLHNLFIGKDLIYDYMRIFFINNEDNYSYSIVSAINDAMAKIREIGTNIFLSNEEFFRKNWFYLTAFIYSTNETFEKFLEILLNAKIITQNNLKNQEIKFLKNNKVKLNNNYVLIVNLIRKLLHHSFDTYIKYEELEKIKDDLNLKENFLNKFKNNEKIYFSLVGFLPDVIFSEKCLINLEVRNFSSKYSKNVFFKFNLYDVLKNTLVI